MLIRKLGNNDRAELAEIIYLIPNFTDEEKDCALELVDITINDLNQKDYYINVIEDNNKIAGYYCVGQRPLTESTWDLYWIVVSPLSSQKGYGSKLLKHAEEFIKQYNGKLLLIETSDTPEYQPSISFYVKNSYSKLANIKNFYKENDHLLILGKYINI